MKYKRSIQVIFGFFSVFLMVSSAIGIPESSQTTMEPVEKQDFDPENDIWVTVEIQQIRSFERRNRFPYSIQNTDLLSKPDLYVKVFINDVEFKSPVWHNTRYVYQQPWIAELDVPDDEEWVNITIQVWDWNIGFDTLCDISREYYGNARDMKELTLEYSVKTGHWAGDDFIEHDPTSFDPSGYGRASGIDDGSLFEDEDDCEIWFDVYQNDTDGDMIPYFAETEYYGTDPTVDDTGFDPDGDGVPIEWEHRYGHAFGWDWHSQEYVHYWIYDPFEWEDHANLDPDDDGLTNFEEFRMWGWGSDPFRQDLFIEMDYMETSPAGVSCRLSERSKELLRTSFNRQNIVLHLDDGLLIDCAAPYVAAAPVSDCDMIPFSEYTGRNNGFQQLYQQYFIHFDEENWKQGVFHYGPVVNSSDYQGFAWYSGVGDVICFQISAGMLEELKVWPHAAWRRDVVQASVYMHELGHTMGIFHGNTPGCDDQLGRYPWEVNWWRWGPYMSCMNYRYTYFIVDYSDGTRGANDFNDWDTIDLTYFSRPKY